MTIWSPKIDRSDLPITRTLLETLRDDIKEGRLPKGSRLPTHRDLARQLGVAIGTVTRVYAIARQEGLVSGEVGRGTFVGTGKEFETDLNDELGGDVAVDLSRNRVTSSLTDATIADGLRDLISDSRLANLLDNYHPAAGLKSHREAGASWLSRPGFSVDPERTLVCSGTQHALFTTMATLTKPGDVVLTENVTYCGMRAVASLLQLRLVGVESDEDGIVPEALKAAFAATGARVVYLIPTLQNPTSTILPEIRRLQVASIAMEQNMLIVEDDVYGFIPGDSAPLPISAHIPDNTFYINGVSKSIAPGLRIGYVVAPPAFVSRIATATYTSTLQVAPLMAELASLWIRNGIAARTIEQKRIEIGARHRLAREIFGDAGAGWLHPSCHVWLQLPDPWRSVEFAVQARARGVEISPSEAFVAGRAAAPHCVRICLGSPAVRAQLASGLTLLAELLRTSPEPGYATV